MMPWSRLLCPLLHPAHSLRPTATPQAEVAANAGAESPATTQAPAVTASSSSSTASTCRVRCNKRCSYPGHCRKYVDSNGNGKCDLGECLA